MQFKRLKMTGFKSFAEPEEVIIDDGMTGIVGPNGCGKSNIVEAMRWVMGESSAKNMRGEEGDDVIFSGTTARPSRNFAEVTLLLDNTAATGPEHLRGTDEVEISRKLDRGTGSTYRINGKVVRARDVQLLFADMATGARSSGIVSQGKVDAIINAKPRDRRNLLEEAASISGLHKRRHEAELRLNNAEVNLGRLHDILVQLGEQKAALAKQARQAARYRTVAERIRKATAHLLLARFTAGMTACDETERALFEARREVAAATETATIARRKRDEAADGMPPLRAAEAEAAAELQRLTLADNELDNEAARTRTALENLQARKAQIADDTAREEQLRADAETALANLAGEAEAIELENREEAPRMEAAAEALANARREAEAAEAAAAESAAKARSAGREREAITRRLDDIQTRITAAESATAGIDLEGLRTTAGAAATALKTAEANAHDAIREKGEAEDALVQSRAALDEATTSRDDTAAALTRMAAERDTLRALIMGDDGDGDDTAPPVSSAIRLAEGIEAEDALAAILGEGLSAPVRDTGQAAQNRNAFWQQIADSAKPQCPDGTTPLAEHITAPAALTAALAGVGIAASPEEAAAMQAGLLPGQAVTTKKGGLWRWDGFTQPIGAGLAGARRLKQEARLREIESTIGALESDAEAAATARDRAAAAMQECETALTAKREAEAAATATLNDALRDDARARDTEAAATSRAAEIKENLTGLATAKAEAEAEAAALDDPAGLVEAAESMAATAADARNALAEAMGAERAITSGRAIRDRRRGEITGEQDMWQKRQQGAGERITELARRTAEAESEEAGLREIPAQIEQKREALRGALEAAEAKRRATGDALAEAENALRTLDRELREADEALATAREESIRREAASDMAKQQQSDIVSRITEKLGAAPDALAEIAGLKPDDPIETGAEAIATLEAREARLLRERDNVGPVNLRAEEEMAEIEERVTGLEIERDDLVAAIAKLRTAINRLNREGRERLLKSFTEVNRYFGAIFGTLFNGGTAQLSLTEDEDPLEAGLEILASPPGKKLQSLGLLSGGEKALTAIALIFAVFLTNPSPICILDEVDAPLDDSNVARFCDVLGQITGRTGTRFIVVTHHRLTMARMDRLYGVTMEHKGVSRVVSVDLQAAEKYDKTA